MEASDKFRTGLTLRFPRFRQLRSDKRWDQALSLQEFQDLKHDVERTLAEKEKEFKIEASRRKKARTSKKPLTVAGNETLKTPYAGPESNLFDGLSFYIMTEQLYPTKMAKAELESRVKANGGTIVQRDAMDNNLIIVADKRLIKVAALIKRDTNNIVKPVWIQDCIAQNEADAGALPYLLPYEQERHLFYVQDNNQLDFFTNVDEYGDSYARDIADVEEMRMLLDAVGQKKPLGTTTFNREEFLTQLEDHGESFAGLKTHMFSHMKVLFHVDEQDVDGALRAQLARNYVRFGGGVVVEHGDENGITHIVVEGEQQAVQFNKRKHKISNMARTVGIAWIEKCWHEGTRLDEERFQWA